ncbi:DUF2259 domain-containing protein [Rhizobium sp. AAP43]|uniref:DUF2259 domain-containing protein n=1 Tax=Rhizobium sp. AAP43 TaxID=1523420 RepID=UPI0006B8B46F|nr:DUF2259 domain-containing protein [Rhizobium sp. AAP43]KPF44094.1 hypothetical protein IP76_11875 [Rhizobium sp. AAP43]
MKASALVLILIALLTTSAKAGDVAEMRPHGFSQDGRYFAYEEFGEQDGSGFPYSSVSIIDTETDSFVPGTPIDVLVKREDATIGEARRESATKASALFEAHGIGEDPGYLAAFNPVSELGQEFQNLRYQATPSLYVADGIYRLKLEQFSASAEGICKDLTVDVQGFRLTLADDAKPADARKVYEDQRVPTSRHCPSSYGIAGVVTPRYGSKGPHMVMVQMLTLGFEGNNVRWLAVPVRP